MKKLILVFSLISSSLSTAFSQTLEWKKNMFPTVQSHPSVGGPIPCRINSTQIGPDGRIYSIGYFGGNRVNFNGTIIKADSLGFRKWRIASGANPTANIPESILVSCHESNGNLAWVKTITTAENTAFGLQSGFGDSYSGRNNLNFDSNGNILVGGAIVGDTLSFDGVPFEFDITYSQRAFVIKISPNGSLLWGRSEIAGSPDRYPTARSLRERNGVIEAYFTGADNNPAYHRMIRTTSGGAPLPSVVQASVSTFAGVNGLSAHENMSNGKVLYGSLTFQTSPIRSAIIELNPDLTTSKETTADLNNSSTLVPSSFHTMADSQRVVILSTNALVAGSNQLIWGDDTLNITANTSTSAERSVFIRLSNLDCMKKVGYLNYVTVGQNVTTPNRNIVLLRESTTEETTTDPGLALKLIDQNGDEQASLALGNLGLSPGVRDGYMFANRHCLSWQNGAVAGCYGKFLFKASLPDPVVAEQSFADCLSNRNILLANEKVLTSNANLKLFEKEPGLWVVQSLIGNNADLVVVSLMGQHLQTVKMENGSASFSTKGMSAGMYLLRTTSSRGSSDSQRIIVK